MLRGITVTLWERTENGVDAFNHPRYDETPVTVKNVLVTPAGETGSELLDATDLVSREADYTLAIPKGDAHRWETGCRVEFFGDSFRIIGKPTKGIEALIPLSWNMKVRVQRIE
ncbi:MAG: hypothetical protein J6A79_09835 [Clostridia bacterium]|nr:hypothetical protein [Clostridia bacterium]